MSESVQKALEKAILKCAGAHVFDPPTIKFWLPTGSPVLDRAIRGWKPALLPAQCGLPGGKWIDVYGRPHGGKTTTGLRAGVQCQRLGGQVVYINAGQELNLDLAYDVGCAVSDTPTEHWMCCTVFSIDRCCEVLELVVKERHALEEPTLIIVDCLSSLGVHEYSMDEHGIRETAPSSAEAKFLHRWFRRGVGYYMNGSKIVVWAIRHQTDSPRQTYSDTKTHGSAPDFNSWLTLKMSRSDLQDTQDAAKGKRGGSWIHAEIKKNKVGPLYGEASFPFFEGRGFDEGWEVVHALQEHGLVKKNGSYIVWEEKSIYQKELVKLYNESDVAKAQCLTLLATSTGRKTAPKK